MLLHFSVKLALLSNNPYDEEKQTGAANFKWLFFTCDDYEPWCATVVRWVQGGNSGLICSFAFGLLLVVDTISYNFYSCTN